MTSRNRILPVIRAGLALLADVAFPPRCPSCRADVAAAGHFCAECFAKLRMIANPMCAQCGVPFAIPVEPGTQCPECLDAPPAFDVARAVMVYDGTSAPLITALKFNDQWSGVDRHAQTMAGVGRALFQGADVIVPVPLHWRRLFKRKYNQSALLAYGVARQAGLPCQPQLLARVQATPPQMALDRAARKKNVRKAFAVPEKQAAALRGKTVLLVDDVITTGATVSACATALKKAGAREVRVLALARTVRE